MKKLNRKMKNSLKLSKGLAVFAIVINHKFLLSKRLEAKVLLKMQNVHRDVGQLRQIQHGVI